MNSQMFRRRLLSICLALASMILMIVSSYAQGGTPGQPRAYLPALFKPLVEPGTECPAWLHDQYQVKGPDGKMYPTWHPQIDPTHKCYFAHEHGDDPRTSLADATLPPFGYVAQSMSMPMDEPHVGFKVFVLNKGAQFEGGAALASSRIVAHMGTGGVKRYTERFHSLEYDLIAPDGHYVHVQGMADTGLAGDICQRDTSLQNNDPDDDIGRTFSALPNSCAANGGTYEIWVFKLKLHDQAEIIVSTAVFDPVLTMNPANLTQAIRTDDVWGGTNLGCDREAYHGPVHWFSADPTRSDLPTVFNTDAMGHPGGPLRQEVSEHYILGIPMSSGGNGTTFKYRNSACAPGLKPPN